MGVSPQQVLKRAKYEDKVMTISAPNFDTEAAVSTPPANSNTRFNRRERRVIKSVSDELSESWQSISNVLSHRFVQAEIDFTNADNRTAADHGLGVTIPAGAVVTRVLTKVNANISSTSSDTIQLFLGASSGGLSLSAAITASGSTIRPWTVEALTDCPGRTAATASELTVKIDNNPITSVSGKVMYLVEYVIPA